MKKALLMVLFFAVIFTLQVSPASAWSVPTHYDIVEKTYYALPDDAQSKLSLDVMKDGADDPDLKFFDFQYHKYPANQVKVDYWLNRGKQDYKSANYHDASYSFGVASHYISDGFSAPHCEDNASHFYHSLYEVRALFLNTHLKKSNGNMDDIMEKGEVDGKKSWESWINNENDFYIQNDLDSAGSAAYTAIRGATA